MRTRPSISPRSSIVNAYGFMKFRIHDIKLRALASCAALCLCAVADAAHAVAQTPTQPSMNSAANAAGAATAASPAPSARTHVERFSTPEMRAEREEGAATAKLKINPNDADALNARAVARMRFGRYREAHEDLRRAVGLAPANADYQANLGYVLWKLGRPAEAIAAERAAIRLDDKNFTAHYQLGRFLLRAGGDADALKEAAAHLRRALEIEPRQPETRFELIAVYRALGDTLQAAAQLSILRDARSADARVTYIDALLASDRNDLNAAIAGFREALRRDPTLVGAWQDLGVAFIKQQRWNDAVETFNELTRRQSDSVDAAYFHALALYNAGRSRDAESEARRALRLDAGASAAHTLLGLTLFTRDGASVEARDALMQAAALDPTNFDAHYYLGRVQGDMRDYVAAIRSLSTAVKLNPKHAFARFLYGYALEVTGELDAALAEYQALIQLDENSAFGQLGLGALLVKQGKLEEAVAALRRSIALDASIAEAHWSLGRALALAKRYPEAAEAFQKSVELAPTRPDGHYQLGLMLQRLGRAEEAKRALDAAARLTKAFRTGVVEP